MGNRVVLSKGKSRQQKWQQSRKRLGLCTCCGQEPLVTKNYGLNCAAKIREKARKRTKAKRRYAGCQSYQSAEPQITLYHRPTGTAHDLDRVIA